MDPRLAASAASPACASAACAPALVVRADINLGSRKSLRHEVERCSGRDQLFLLGALLEVPDDALRVLHHPPAYVALVDRLAFLRVFLQVRDAREAKRQLRVVEMLLPLEIDLEVLPLHGMQFVLEPDDAGFAIRRWLLAEEERALVDTVNQPVGRRLAGGK